MSFRRRDPTIFPEAAVFSSHLRLPAGRTESFRYAKKKRASGLRH